MPTPAAPPAAITAAHHDAKLARCRAAHDAAADPAIVAGWIAGTQAERDRAEQQHNDPASIDPIAHIVEEQLTDRRRTRDMAAALREAPPGHELAVYRNARPTP